MSDPDQGTPSLSLPLSARADALEEQMIRALDEVQIRKSVLFTAGDRDPTQPMGGQSHGNPKAAKRVLMGDDPRLPKMPERPTLLDFFRYRFAPSNHLVQSAKLALDAGHDEKVVLACLLHDIAVVGFILPDHGYWGAQLVGPYVDEEVSWAIRAHQALRFYPDESVGYTYPELYVRNFGPDYRPEPYIEEEYQRARAHRWYMTARLITINDVYSFNPDLRVELGDFEDLIGRHFRQPVEGLGFDNSPVAHMWRTIIWPTKGL